MEKIKSHFQLRSKHLISIIYLSLFLVIISIVWGIVFADTPSAPSGLTYGTITLASVPLSWTDNAENEDKFNIERKLSSASTWSFLTQITTSNTTSYTDSSVTAGNTYDYRVQACLSGSGCSENAILEGVSVPSTTTSNSGGDTTTATTTTTTIPSAPTSLNLGTVTSTSVSLSWTDNAENEDKFNIERKLNTSSSWSTLTQITTSNTTSYTDTSVTAGISYDYRVQACLSGAGCSEYSTIEGISILSPTSGGGTNNTTSHSSTSSVVTSIPYAPTDLSLSSTTSTTISIKWTDNANNEDKFNIERKLNTSSSWSTLTQITTSNTTSYTDTSVTAGISYDYRVQACLSGAGCSEYSTLSGASSLSSSRDGENTTIITPLPPTNLSLDKIVIPLRISLMWEDKSNNEDKFNIERKLSTSSSWSYIGRVDRDNLHYVDSDVTVGTIYDYRVQACSLVTQTTELCSSYVELKGVQASTTITVPPLLNPPLAPSNLSLSESSTPTSVSLKWTDKSNNEDKFNIERKLSSAMVFTLFTTINKVNQSSYVDTNVSPGYSYDYRVQACLYGTGCSGYTYLYKVLVPPKSTPAITLTDTTPTSNIINNEVKNNIDTTNIVNPSDTTKQDTEISREDITKIINTISGPSQEDKSKTLNEETVNLIYKDTNNDGISDYDSIHIYNIDPDKPSLTSTYEGKEINASEKILLGFDPTQEELIKVIIEQPIESTAEVTTLYKVEEVKMTEKKEIVLKGQALPNSFITLYIYSTPIMVTIRTDNNGEWQYTLDKELEDGDHTVYTATVNNSGNIIAKSSGFVFAKTAEAVTLKDLPIAEASVNNIEKPGLLEGKNLYIIIASLLAMIIAILVLTGLTSKKDIQN